MRTLLVLAIVSCGGSAPAPEAVAGRGETRHRDTAAPTLAWADHSLTTTGLPAIARAGQLVVVALSELDGGRGYPNLRVEVRDRRDKTIQSIAVLTPNEYETLAPDGKPTDLLVSRIAAANGELAKLHGLHDLVPMQALDLQHPADGSDEHLAIGDGLDVDWNQDHLHVFPHNTDRGLTTVDGRGWLVPEHKSCPSCDPCQTPAHLTAVYHAPSINVVVVRIAYRSSDTCGDPSDQLHVVGW